MKVIRFLVVMPLTLALYGLPFIPTTNAIVDNPLLKECVKDADNSLEASLAAIEAFATYKANQSVDIKDSRTRIESAVNLVKNKLEVKSSVESALLKAESALSSVDNFNGKFTSLESAQLEKWKTFTFDFDDIKRTYASSQDVLLIGCRKYRNLGDALVAEVEATQNDFDYFAKAIKESLGQAIQILDPLISIAEATNRTDVSGKDGTPGPNSSTQVKNFSIGYQGPLTGPESSTGLTQLNAVKFTVQIFNETFKGQFKVSLVEIDDQGFPEQAAKVAPTVAANEEILGIVGPAYSLSVIESLPFYKEKLLPLISPSATRPVLTDPTSPGGVLGHPVFHRVVLRDKVQAAAILEFATQGVQVPKIFVVNLREYGEELANNVRDTITSNQFAGVDSVDYRTTDWSAVIGRIEQYKANVVVFTSYSNSRVVRVGDSLYNSEFDVFLKQLRDRGYSGVVIAAATGGMIPLKLISDELEAAFKTSTGNASGDSAAETIDATNVLLSCIADGVQSRSQMLECVKTFSGTSIKGGNFSFDKNGDSTAKGYAARFDSEGVRFFDGNFRQHQRLQDLLPRFPWYKSYFDSIEKAVAEKAAAELKAKQEAETNAKIEALQKAEAEERAKAEAEAKAKATAELKAKQEEAAALTAAAKKKVTITCVKGKLTKKVTAVKPKCPKGYKKK